MHSQIVRPRILFHLLRAMAFKWTQRRFRPSDPKKWPLDAVTPDGERDWLRADPEFLRQKLVEEMTELLEASDASQNEAISHDEVELEAADVALAAAMLADRLGAFSRYQPMPWIVCLCGSTRFRIEYEAAAQRFTFEGKIVLSVGCYPKSEGWTVPPSIKEGLDELHKRKIDLADEVYVLNRDGYVGESTRSEVAYAYATGKPVAYLRPLTHCDGEHAGTTPCYDPSCWLAARTTAGDAR
jgi:hypothetical protein